MMKRFLLYVMAALYFLAGINHYISPAFYLKLLPDWLPAHLPLVYISGIAECVLAVLLIPTSTRKISAVLIVVMLTIFLVLIHIPMLIDYARRSDPLLWLIIARIPLQFLLIAWARQYHTAIS